MRVFVTGATGYRPLLFSIAYGMTGSVGGRCRTWRACPGRAVTGSGPVRHVRSGH